jgi:hypothetical protein
VEQALTGVLPGHFVAEGKFPDDWRLGTLDPAERARRRGGADRERANHWLIGARSASVARGPGRRSRSPRLPSSTDSNAIDLPSTAISPNRAWTALHWHSHTNMSHGREERGGDDAADRPVPFTPTAWGALPMPRRTAKCRDCSVFCLQPLGACPLLPPDSYVDFGGGDAGFRLRLNQMAFPIPQGTGSYRHSSVRAATIDRPRPWSESCRTMRQRGRPAP